MLTTEIIIFAGTSIVGLLSYWIGRVHGHDEGYDRGYVDGNNWAVDKFVAAQADPQERRRG